MTTAPGVGAGQATVTLGTLLVVSLVLAALGWYGWRHPAELVHPGLDEETRWRRERVVRRGSVVCLCVAAGLPALLLAALVQR